MYKNGWPFQNKHVEQYPEGINVFKFQNFYLLVTIFLYHLPLLPSTIYIIHILYKNGWPVQKKNVGQHSEGIGVFKFEKFHLLVMFFHFF